MSQSRNMDEGERPNSSSSRLSTRRNNAPLVIVSERGRHSDESRRIVRAQAARASAAQSRVTRARHREERESGPREVPQSPATILSDSQHALSTPAETARSSYFSTITRPFGNPFSSASQQTPPQQPQSLPQQPPVSTPQQSTDSSYLGTITRPFTNPFGDISYQPPPQQPEPLNQQPPVSTPQDSTGPSYLGSMARPFTNPFGTTSYQAPPQQPEPLPQQPPVATPQESTSSSYLGTIARPFANPFGSTSNELPPQQQETPQQATPISQEESAQASYFGAIARPFGNPFSGATNEHPSQQPEPPQQPTPVNPEEGTKASYFGAIARPFGNHFHGATNEPLPQQQPDATQQNPGISQEEGTQASRFGAMARPFGNPFSSATNDTPQQQQPEQPPQPQEPPQQQPEQQDYNDEKPKDHFGNPLNVPLNFLTQKPLVCWLATLLNISVTQLFTNPYAIPAIAGHTITGATHMLTATGAYAGGAIGSLAGGIQDTGGAFGRIFSTAAGASQGGGGFGSAMPGSISTPGGGSADPGPLQLPRALPRGFSNLNHRIPLPDPLLGLLTRTSCFDFGSPGVEERIHGLLFDLIIGYLKAALSPLTPSGPPVQDHLRIACTCLTIFQGQRANGMIFASEPTYDKGLEAAWSEVQLLDQQALADSRSAEASLWAVFIISVTTGTEDINKGSYFQRVLQGLFEDLQLQAWSDVRRVLLDFIYPVSFLDEPCRAFWEKVQGAGPAGMGVDTVMVGA